MSIYQAVTFGGLALGAWIWGLISDLTGLSIAIYSAALLLLITLPLLRWLAPMPTRETTRAASSASAACTANSSRRSIGSGRPSIRCRSVMPSSSSITISRLPARSRPKSITDTMFG